MTGDPIAFVAGGVVTLALLAIGKLVVDAVAWWRQRGRWVYHHPRP